MTWNYNFALVVITMSLDDMKMIHMRMTRSQGGDRRRLSSKLVPDFCPLHCWEHNTIREHEIRIAWRWNIARGTTDPGYWVYNLNHVSDWNWFEIILAEKVYSSYGSVVPLAIFFSSFCTLNYFKFISVRNLIQVIDSIPWVRCASGNV